MDSKIRVYGAEWCGDTNRTRSHLAKLGVDYEFLNIDDNADLEQKVTEWGNGKRIIPVVEISAKGEVRRLTEPSNTELDDALREAGTNPRAA